MLPFSMLAPNNINLAHVFGIGELKIDYSKIATFGAVSTTFGKDDKEVQKEINKLVAKYYDAKQKVDMTELEECVSDINNVQQQKLLTEAEYVEGYSDFECLVLNAVQGTYRVYARYNVKIYNIDTLIPSLSALYVTEDEEGNFKVFMGALNSEEQEVMNTLDQLQIVKDMSSQVSSELYDVIKNDEKVGQFYQMLKEKTEADSEEESIENIDNEATFESDSSEDKDSEKSNKSDEKKDSSKSKDKDKNKKNKKKN